MLWPAMSMRSMIGSSMPRGRSARILATASRTSFSARSLLTSSRNSMAVRLVPSVTVDSRCFTPVTAATASSIFFVTCASSSPGAAPGWVTVMDTMGTSMLGVRVIGSMAKPTSPRIVSTANSTSGGIGLRMAAPEMLNAMLAAPGRSAGRHGRHPVAAADEGAGHRHHRLARAQPVLDFRQ